MLQMLKWRKRHGQPLNRVRGLMPELPRTRNPTPEQLAILNELEAQRQARTPRIRKHKPYRNF